MQKTISALKARRNLGQILEAVYYRGDQYVIERAGKPMAVVVPIEQFEQWRKKRREFFALIDKIRKRNEGKAPAQIERDIAKALVGG
jgi:prevent-host-death family protein